MKKLLTAALAFAAASAPLNVFAEDVTTSNATIDDSQKGSITLYKLKSSNGQYEDGTGLETEVDEETIDGVTFTYLKVGEIVQVTDAGAKNGVYYTLSDDFAAEAKTILSGGYAETDDHYKKALDSYHTMIGNTEYFTSENVNKIMKAINETEISDDVETSGDDQINAWIVYKGTAMNPTKEGKTTASGLELGLYLVAETGTPAADTMNGTIGEDASTIIAKKSIPFLLSVPMTNIAKIGDHEAGTVWQYDITAYPKNETLTVSKNIIADGNDANDAKETAKRADYEDGTLVRHTDKAVGDYVKFLLSSDIPVLQPENASRNPASASDGDNGNSAADNTGNDIDAATKNTNRKYVLTDTLSAGLHVDDTTAKNFTVKYGAGAYTADDLKEMDLDTDYTVAYNTDGNKNEIVITLTTAGLAKFDAIKEDSHLYVTYSARLTKDAVVDDTNKIKEEKNDFVLTYGTSVSADIDLESNKDVRVYAYEMDVTKSFQGASANLTDVKFEVRTTDSNVKVNGIYADDGLINWVEEKAGIYHIYDGKEEATLVTTVSPDENGSLILKGLDAQNYVLKEVATAQGYNLLRDEVTVSPTAASPEDGKIASATVKSGKETNAVAISDDTGFGFGAVRFTIDNNESIAMLRTGGNGWGTTGIAVAAGCGIIALAVVLIKKKNEKDGEEQA